MIWNLITLQRYKKESKRVPELNDAKYYELKYKYEFVVAVISVIVTAVAVVGYNSIQSVEAALKNDFTEKVDSTNKNIERSKIETDLLRKSFEDSLKQNLLNTKDELSSVNKNSNAVNQKMKETESSLQHYNTLLGALAQKQLEIEIRNRNSDTMLNIVANKIEEINSKNILKQNFYIVDSLYYSLSVMETAKTDTDSFVKYYFKDLTTTIGDKLPKFKSPPFIIVTSPNSSGATVREVTSDYFSLAFFEYLNPDKQNRITFNILVSEK
jgi:predicted phage tail protein